MRWQPWLLVVLLSIVMLSACSPKQSSSSSPLLASDIHSAQYRAPVSQVILPRQRAVSTPTTPSGPQQHAPTPTPSSPQTARAGTPTDIPSSGTGASPYGSPPAPTDLERQLTQQLFAQINSDRAARGLYAYTWNTTLAGGARLHSWNMYHCGFSHTCPDGLPQCQRIANEGFAGVADCGENIGYAGPFPTPWQGVYKIQESMVNEPPTGWHRIHLFSTTLHQVGVGVYVDPSGYIWFTEDMVS